MEAPGDKLATKYTGTPNINARKGGKTGGAFARVKFGSATVPIYRSQSKGRTRYFVCYHSDGKRLRQTFADLAAAKKEAQLVAQRIQAGMQHVTDLKPHERDNYARAVSHSAARAWVTSGPGVSPPMAKLGLTTHSRGLGKRRKSGGH